MGLRGVLDVKARLTGKNQGETGILYNPAEVSLENLKQAVLTASGERHNFTVISVIEEA